MLRCKRSTLSCGDSWRVRKARKDALLRRPAHMLCARRPHFFYGGLLWSPRCRWGKQHMRAHLLVRSIRSLPLIAGVVVGLSASASAMAAAPLSHGPDPLFHDKFEDITAGPFNDSDASRFLAQATFGPTDASSPTFVAWAIKRWLNEQFGAAGIARNHLSSIGSSNNEGQPNDQRARAGSMVPVRTGRSRSVDRRSAHGSVAPARRVCAERNLCHLRQNTNAGRKSRRHGLLLRHARRRRLRQLRRSALRKSRSVPRWACTST